MNEWKLVALIKHYMTDGKLSNSYLLTLPTNSHYCQLCTIENNLQYCVTLLNISCNFQLSEYLNISGILSLSKLWLNLCSWKIEIVQHSFNQHRHVVQYLINKLSLLDVDNADRDIRYGGRTGRGRGWDEKKSKEDKPFYILKKTQ